MGGAGEIYMPQAERDSILLEVEACDKEAEVAQGKRDHQNLLVQLEKGLHLRRKLYQEASREVTAACRRLCEAYNYAATVLLQQDNLKGAHELLKRAEQVADKSDLDRAITWNNMACYYRRTGKLRTAVTFLERALLIEEYNSNADAAQTHLNICATLSQLQRHSEALHHAQSALIRVYEILGPRLYNGDAREGGSEESREQFTVLCIAYHNLAVEQEHLKKYEAAACAYAEGYRWASRFLGETHQLVGILRESAETVKAKLPPTSGALQRISEIMEGWPQAEGAASRSQAERSGHLDLLTPRNPIGSVEGELDTAVRESPTPQGSYTEGGPSKASYSEDFSQQSDFRSR